MFIIGIFEGAKIVRNWEFQFMNYKYFMIKSDTLNKKENSNDYKKVGVYYNYFFIIQDFELILTKHYSAFSRIVNYLS
jgi:hypothetical protein